MSNWKKAIKSFLIWLPVSGAIYFFAHIESWESFRSMNIGYYLLIYLLSSVLVVPVSVFFWEGWEEKRKEDKERWEQEKAQLDEERQKDRFMAEHHRQFNNWLKGQENNLT